MTEDEMKRKISVLTLENTKLKAENKKLKQHNDELIKCIEVYQEFITGGKPNA